MSAPALGQANKPTGTSANQRARRGQLVGPLGTAPAPMDPWAGGGRDAAAERSSSDASSSSSDDQQSLWAGASSGICTAGCTIGSVTRPSSAQGQGHHDLGSSSTSPKSPAEGNACWICLDGGHDTQGRPLCRPCACPRWCHRTCLSRCASAARSCAMHSADPCVHCTAGDIPALQRFLVLACTGSVNGPARPVLLPLRTKAWAWVRHFSNGKGHLGVPACGMVASSHPAAACQRTYLLSLAHLPPPPSCCSLHAGGSCTLLVAREWGTARAVGICAYSPGSFMCSLVIDRYLGSRGRVPTLTYFLARRAATLIAWTCLAVQAPPPWRHAACLPHESWACP